MTADGRWDALAPHWELFELDNLDPTVLDGFRALLRDPVLVIGAGQGLLTRPLRAAGRAVVGIDSSRAMVARGRQRRGEPNLVADARALPFAAGAFSTAVLATGTVDFMMDEPDRLLAVREARRVVAGGGRLLAFFTCPIQEPRVAAARALGIVESDTVRGDRALALWSAGVDPARWAAMIADWLGLDAAAAGERVRDHRGALDYLMTSLDHATRPVVERLSARGEDPMVALAASLAPIPLWTPARIAGLLAAAGAAHVAIRTLPRLFCAVGG